MIIQQKIFTLYRALLIKKQKQKQKNNNLKNKKKRLLIITKYTSGLFYFNIYQLLHKEQRKNFILF